MTKITEKDKSNIINFDHESRITRLEVIIENINHTLIRLDKRMDVIEKDIKDNFKWTITTMIGFALVLCGIMARGFHWF